MLGPAQSQWSDCLCPGKAVGQFNPHEELAAFHGGEWAPHDDHVLLLHAKTWVGKPVGQFTVIGQHEQTACLHIQPSDRDKPWYLKRCRDQIHHAVAVSLISSRGEVPLRFVEEQIDRCGATGGDDTVVHTDSVGGSDDLGEVARFVAVYFNPSGHDGRGAFASGAHPRGDQIFNQAQGCGLVCLVRDRHREFLGVEAYPTGAAVAGRGVP